MRAMKDQYGPKEGEKVFYASKNRGTIEGVDEEVRGTASPAMKALMKRTAELKARRDRIALMKANKKRKDDETQMNWQNRIYESLTESRARYGGMVGYSGGGGKNKPGVIMSIETDKDGNKFVVKKDKEGNVISRKPAKPLPGKK